MLLVNFMDVGEYYCGENWVNFWVKYKEVEEKDFLKYCFFIVYIVVLMYDSFGISMYDDWYVEYENF